jgi:4-hydroxybenzoate polyprenyltransferase
MTRDSSFARRFYGWIEERFPLANGLLFFVVYAAALILGRHAGGGRVALHASDLFGFAAAWSFFLMLRVFDEHKDYAQDCRLYPERVLSRGLITLRHLKIVGALAIAVQLGVSLWHDGGIGPVTLRWLVVLGFSLLMLREFFVRQWLSRHLVVYAASHMIVTPLSILWMAQMGAGGARLDAGTWAYAGMSFLFGFCFEIARKMKAPSEERAGVDTYTRLFGVWRVAFTVAVLWALATTALALILILTGVDAASPLLWAGVVALAVPSLVVLERFAHRPSPKAAKLAQAVVGLSMLIANGSLVGTLIARGGRP